MTLFKPAQKYEAKLRMAVVGPSGAGKTWTSLAVATHLANGGRVAVVDTEHGSASKYSPYFDFDVLNMNAPFHPDRFIEAIVDAEENGYDVIILDSISHAWSGTGGLLEIVDAAAVKYKGNKFAAWSEGTPIHNRFIEAIVGSTIHVIATMRSKTEYILQERDGKQVPTKVGMAPIQRDQMEFNFDVVLEMDIENNAIVSKTRCPALAGAVIPKPGADLAQTLLDWLSGEKPPTAEELQAAAEAAQTLGDFVYHAFRLPGPANTGVFESEQRLADWYAFVAGDFDPALNEAVLDALDSYCDMVDNGARVKQAAETAKKQVQAVIEATAAVAADEEE